MLKEEQGKSLLGKIVARLSTDINNYWPVSNSWYLVKVKSRALRWTDYLDLFQFVYIWIWHADVPLNMLFKNRTRNEKILEISAAFDHDNITL